MNPLLIPVLLDAYLVQTHASLFVIRQHPRLSAARITFDIACKVSLAAAQLPVPEAVPSKGSAAQATDIRKDGGGIKGGEFSISS